MATNKVFIVCENDDYGRDLFLGVYNTREEAEDYGGRITHTIYEHETLEEEARVPIVGDIVRLSDKGVRIWGGRVGWGVSSKLEIIELGENRTYLCHNNEKHSVSTLWLELDEMEIV